MDNGPLVKEEIDGGRELLRRLNNYRTVKAAFWLKASESPYRYLYFACDRTDTHKEDLSYQELLPVFDELNDPELDPFRLKVVSADHPLVRDAVKKAEQFPLSLGRRSGGSRFGDLFAEDLYIYPLPVPEVVG